MNSKAEQLAAAITLVLVINTAVADSIDLPLKEKADYCVLVAEVLITNVTKYGPDSIGSVNWTADCSVLRYFKSPITNREMSLDFNPYDTNVQYVGKSAVIFAFQLNGRFRPFNGDLGIIKRGDKYTDYTVGPPHPEIDYDELIRELEDLFKPSG